MSVKLDHTWHPGLFSDFALLMSFSYTHW